MRKAELCRLTTTKPGLHVHFRSDLQPRTLAPGESQARRDIGATE